MPVGFETLTQVKIEGNEPFKKTSQGGIFHFKIKLLILCAALVYCDFPYKMYAEKREREKNMNKQCGPYEIITDTRVCVLNTEDAYTATKQQLGRWVVLYVTAFFLAV